VSHTSSLLDKNISVGEIFSKTLCFIAIPFHRCYDIAQASFFHAIQIIESHIGILGEYNAATDVSLIFLEQSIHTISDLIGDETHELTQEIGELLAQLWTWLGANRSRLARMNYRVSALYKVGNHTAGMRSSVWHIRQELDFLQQSTATLRDLAAEPLLLNGPLPRSLMLRQLSQGCQDLQMRFLGDKAVRRMLGRRYKEY